MPTLKDVADRSKVPLLTAFYALSNLETVTEQETAEVLRAAESLGYRLSITIRDVAALAEVSIATVSYVLNNSYPVRADTRERVIQAASLLGYRPNSTARNLQASETRLIGYAWHGAPLAGINPTLDRFLYWMAHATAIRGYHVLTFALPSLPGISAYEELIQTNRVDGFVLADTNHNDVRIPYLLDKRIPFVAFGRANDAWDFPYVDVDGHKGMSLITEHLIANGHRRIGFIGWPSGSLSGDERLKGYHDTLCAAGIGPREEWIVRTLNTSQHGAQATERLMSLPTDERPTAFVCISDMVAVGAMNCLAEMGLRVGQEVAVTGFDDDPMSQLLRPPLTTIHQPIDQIAALVADNLIAQVQRNPLPQRQTLIAPTLVIRASSGS